MICCMHMDCDIVSSLSCSTVECKTSKQINLQRSNPPTSLRLPFVMVSLNVTLQYEIERQPTVSMWVCGSVWLYNISSEWDRGNIGRTGSSRVKDYSHMSLKQKPILAPLSKTLQKTFVACFYIYNYSECTVCWNWIGIRLIDVVISSPLFHVTVISK